MYPKCTHLVNICYMHGQFLHRHKNAIFELLLPNAFFLFSNASQYVYLHVSVTFLGRFRQHRRTLHAFICNQIILSPRLKPDCSK